MGKLAHPLLVSDTCWQPHPPLSLPQSPGWIPLRPTPVEIAGFSLGFSEGPQPPSQSHIHHPNPNIIRFLDWTVRESPRPRLSGFQEGAGRICDEML